MIDHSASMVVRCCKSEIRLSLVIAFLGVLFYFFLSDPLCITIEARFLGHKVYDYYLWSLLDGRFDVPIRIVSYEGHYNPSGKAFVYHGLFPILPRAVMALFVDLETINSNRWVVFGLTAAASAMFHYTIFLCLRRVDVPAMERRRWIALTGVMCWTASAGPIVASNSAIYNETFASALLAVSIAGYIFARLIVFQDPVIKHLIGFAVCVVIALHSRSTIAFGLALSFSLLWGFQLIRIRRDAIRPLILSALICATGLGILLASNYARFGNVTQMHGSLDPEQDQHVQHAVIYWGLWEKQGKDYAENFVKHGTFNIGRLPANLMMQVVGLPHNFQSQLELYGTMLKAYGPPRIWGPYAGIVFLWMPWIVMIIYTLMSRKVALRPESFQVLNIAMIGGLATTLLIFCFASLHFRYRVDLWPLISVLSIFSIAGFFHRDQPIRLRRQAYLLTSMATVLAVFFSATSAFRHTQINQDLSDLPGEHFYALWSKELCFQLVAEKRLPPDQHDELCDLS